MHACAYVRTFVYFSLCTYIGIIIYELYSKIIE